MWDRMKPLYYTDFKTKPHIHHWLLLDNQNCVCNWSWSDCVITMVSISIHTRWGKRHVIFGHIQPHMHAWSPHTRQSTPPSCLEWKHSQGWRGKSGKHFFRRKQKNTSWACCYCAVLGCSFVCWDNSRTFKWRPGTEPETRAHHWRWGEKVFRPPCVCVCERVCLCPSLGVCSCVLSHWKARHHWPPWLQGQGAEWCAVGRKRGLRVMVWVCMHEWRPVHMTECVCLQITWTWVLTFLKGAG